MSTPDQQPKANNWPRIVVTVYERRNAINGKPRETTWPELVRELREEPEQCETKDGAAFIFGAVLPDADGNRRHKKEQIDELHALAVDVDDAPEDAVIEALVGLQRRGLAYQGWPTFSQLTKPSPDSVRCRLVFPLSSPVPGKKWDAFWRAAVRDLGLEEIADPTCKDASHLYYHTCPPAKLKEFGDWCTGLFANDGAPLDVAAISAEPERGTGSRSVDLNARELIADGGVRIAPCPRGTSLFEHAEELCRTMPPAISGAGGHVSLLRVARALRWGLDLPPEQCEPLITDLYNPRCSPPWSAAEIRHKIDDAGKETGAPYPRGALLPEAAPNAETGVPVDALKMRNGRPEPTVSNTALILSTDIRWRGVIRFDEFANRTLCAAEPPMREHDRPSGSCIGDWSDAHSTRARAWLAENWDYEPGKDVIESAVDIAARRNSFHPVQEFLLSLRWDGKPRLARLLSDYFGADANEYTAIVGTKFMISAVARAMSPGCKVDTMLILEGDQGTKKSTAVRVLAGDAWFADTPLDLESKDAAQCLRGKWIYEIGELDSFSRSEVTRIKAFVSSQSDNYRPSYGRRNVDHPRMCVFVGTTNGNEYLSDTTGNRRFWPVQTSTIDVAALKRDRDQLWAEATSRYQAQEPWWLDSAAERLAVEEQAKREAPDPWEARIEEWLRGHEGDVTTGAVLTALGVPEERQSRAHATRVGQILQKLKYTPRRKTLDDGRRVRVYAPGQPGQP